ncbi:MAG: toll/interleukin-1 receptor domain-containing protein [Bacteroidales bacterium]|nr:toll/interleukin-1 receptor domain-containing protein [Bacteroidales bacterium]
MAYDVFISYSRKDSGVAEEICSALTEAGLSFFIDKEGIEAGQNFPQVLAEAVDSATVFLFLASQNSFRSKFTRGEVTYAFNHKHSGTIIPYIIDGSESMPPDLELMLGNFNWRRKELCPIRPMLIEDIRKAIANPEEGTIGGREVMSPRKKKILTWSAVSIVALLVIAAVLFAMSNSRDKKENQVAMDASRTYEQLIDETGSLIRQADELKNSDRSLETTEDQIASLQQACQLLDSAAAIRHSFEDSPYKGLFNKDMSGLSTAAHARLDSIHAAWTNYALESYSFYQMTKTESERENVLGCIDYALSIKPNAELETIKNNLN